MCGGLVWQLLVHIGAAARGGLVVVQPPQTPIESVPKPVLASGLLLTGSAGWVSPPWRTR